jgi:hypothetical protein
LAISGYLLENEMGWVSSSLFFHSLLKLGIRPDPYFLPVGMVVSPEEITYYTGELQKDLDSLATQHRKLDNDLYVYVQQIVDILARWGSRGHIVHVV